MNKLLITIILTSFVFTQTDGDYVKNVTASQRTDGTKIVDIYYDLEEAETYLYYNVYATGEWPGADHVFNLQDCTGDVWNHIFPGDNKHIECRLASNNDWETMNLSGEFLINVHATASTASDIPNSFTMIPIPSSTSDLIDYDFELMDKEVSAVQYVEFLNSILSSAVTVENNDTDYWPDQEGGETYDRIYTLENGKKIRIYASNDSQNDSYQGQVMGYASSLPAEAVVIEDMQTGEYPQFATWMPLYYIGSNVSTGCSSWDENGQTDCDYTLIQFTSTAAGANDFAFLINEGHGNHPVQSVSYYGADAFADYYGTRIPFRDEYIAILGSLDTCVDGGGCNNGEEYWTYIFGGNDLNPNDYNSPFCSQNYDTCGENEQFSECVWYGECSATPVGSLGNQFGSEFYDLLGNLYDMFIYRGFNGGVSWDDNYLEYYEIQGFGGGYSHWSSMYTWTDNPEETDFSLGFRCARTISGNNND